MESRNLQEAHPNVVFDHEDTPTCVRLREVDRGQEVSRLCEHEKCVSESNASTFIPL